MAYGLIQELNLQDYYRIQEQLQRTPPQAKNSDQADELYDHPEFQKSFCEFTADGKASCHLYVDNLNCYACVWVCEQAIRKLDPELIVSVNLASGRALIEFDPQTTKLSAIVKRFSQLGYPVSPNRNHSQQNRKDLARIGISGFCLMNLMLLAISDYMDGTSIDAQFYQLFRWISLILASICMIFAARPFYVNFFKALRQREIHMDMPISIAIISCYLYSAYHVILGEGPLYFDSLTGIVFLLLVGRYFQKQSMQKHLRRSALQLKEQIEYVRRLEDGEVKMVSVTSVCRDDKLRILPGGMVPVKSRLLSEQAELNYELMSGEARWHNVKQGEEIEAGSINSKQTIEVVASENGMDSYLQRLKDASVRLSEGKSQMLHTSQAMSKFLSSLVMIVGFVTLMILREQPNEAVARFCAILLIACPCAFGFGTPLILARAFEKGLRRGVLWNHPRGLEQLARVKKFYFDKTGTLTQPFGKVKLLEWNCRQKQLNNPLLLTLASLDQYHDHHMIRLIAEWAREQVQAENLSDAASWQIDSVKEELGAGLAIRAAEHELRIGRPAFCQPGNAALGDEFRGQTWLVLNGEKIASFELDEQLSQDVKQLFQSLNHDGVEVAILSGDSSKRVAGLIEQVQLPNLKGVGELSPLAKLSHMEEGEKNKTLRAMVGNGFNDGPAIARAEIGIAVHDAAEMAQKNADMILLTDRLSSILDARQVSKSCRQVLHRTFAFSLTYNLIGMTLGALGLLSPVVAAILMPISSLTVITLASKW